MPRTKGCSHERQQAALGDWTLCSPMDDMEDWVFLMTDGDDDDCCTKATEEQQTFEEVTAASMGVGVRPVAVQSKKDLTRAARKQQWRQRVAAGLAPLEPELE